MTVIGLSTIWLDSRYCRCPWGKSPLKNANKKAVGSTPRPAGADARHRSTKKPWSETFAHGLEKHNTSKALCQPNDGHTSSAENHIATTGDTDTIDDRANDAHANHQRALSPFVKMTHEENWEDLFSKTVSRILAYPPAGCQTR